MFNYSVNLAQKFDIKRCAIQHIIANATSIIFLSSTRMMSQHIEPIM